MFRCHTAIYIVSGESIISIWLRSNHTNCYKWNKVVCSIYVEQPWKEWIQYRWYLLKKQICIGITKYYSVNEFHIITTNKRGLFKLCILFSFPFELFTIFHAPYELLSKCSSLKKKINEMFWHLLVKRFQNIFAAEKYLVFKS